PRRGPDWPSEHPSQPAPRARGTDPPPPRSASQPAGRLPSPRTPPATVPESPRASRVSGRATARAGLSGFSRACFRSTRRRSRRPPFAPPRRGGRPAPGCSLGPVGRADPDVAVALEDLRAQLATTGQVLRVVDPHRIESPPRVERDQAERWVE